MNTKTQHTRPHPEGDAPRSEKGERLDRGPDQQEQARPQPSIPEPPAPPAPEQPRSRARE